MRTRNIWVIALVTLTGLGCGKPNLDYKSKFALEAGEAKTLDLDPVKQEQVIKVTGSTTGGPVSVYVYLAKNRPAAERQIVGKKPGDAILAKQDKTDAIDVAASIPANEGACVRVVNTGGTPTVDLRITNR